MVGGDRRKRRAGIIAPEAAAPTDRRWLWWRSGQGARAKGLEEFDSLPVEGRAGLALRIERYKKGESRYKDVDALGDGVFELRHRHGSNHFRVLFMLWGPHCVGLTAFYKNQRSTPKSDLDRARGRAVAWRSAFGNEPPP